MNKKCKTYKKSKKKEHDCRLSNAVGKKSDVMPLSGNIFMIPPLFSVHCMAS